MANSMMFRCRLSRRAAPRLRCERCGYRGPRYNPPRACHCHRVSPPMASWLPHRLLSSTLFRGLSGECRHMPVILTTKARTRISIQVVVVLGCLGAGSAFAPLAAFEIPQERSAATYLGALTEGNNYHVAARVRSDGNMLGGFKFERKHHLTTLERMVRWQEIAYD